MNSSNESVVVSADVRADDEQNVYLSVCLAGDRLGAALYEQATSVVRVLPDVAESPADLRLVRSLVAQVAPTWLLHCARQDERFVEQLRRLCAVSTDESAEEDNVGDECRPSLDEMPLSAYNYGEAKRRLEALFGEERLNETENRMTTAFKIDLDCVSMVRALGALLKYLDVRRVGVELEAYDVHTPITAVQVFTIDNMIEIDSATLRALQVFHREFHPSVFKAGRSGAFKEGLSLFGLCNYCRSAPGKVELRRWFERPLTNQEVLAQRHGAIDFFLRECNQDAVVAVRRALHSVKNVAGILQRMQTSQASIGDWANLHKTIFHLVSIASHLKSRALKNNQLLQTLVDSFSDDLQSSAVLMSDLIDFGEMRVENRFVLNGGVNAEIDDKKRQLAELPEVLTAVAASEYERLQEFVSECAVVYMPMLGYLLKVARKAEWQTTEDMDGIAGLDFVFLSDDTVYYKNATMRQLDEAIGDVKFQIIDAETSVMLGLQRLLVERAATVVAAVRAAAQIDCLLALATAAATLDWVKPRLTTDNVIDVEGGRHPLVEVNRKSGHAVVANAVKSGASKVCLLTGPNASGKSVYLKQVGLIVYLAHIGSFVPASSATIGPIDRIFSRMHTVDSVLDGMSTFARDMQQMATALSRAGGRSLVIVDEFGKGTMTEVGLSLLTSSIEFWLQREAADCPHLFVSSHLHAVLKLLPDSPLLAYKTLEVLRRDNGLEFTYRLVDGTVDCSFAAYVALQAGLPDALVERGYEVYNCLKSGEVIAEQQTSRQQCDGKLERMDAVVSRFLRCDLDVDALRFLLQLRDENAPPPPADGDAETSHSRRPSPAADVTPIDAQ